MSEGTKQPEAHARSGPAPGSPTRPELFRRWKYVVEQIEEADFAVSGERFAEAAQAIGRAMHEACLCKHGAELLSENEIAEGRRQ